MSDTPRPQAPAPNLDTIPAELIARVQWVCWSYTLDKNGKWTKVPYTPGTTDKASHSRPASWRSFAEAVATYHARPDFFSGIGYVFAKDDPYVGGDIDHSLDQARVPPTYAEISPSGNGIKFIARASGTYGRKTARGELYSKTRFFTITGNVLPGHETITACQEAVEAFAASLGTPKTLKDGIAGSGSRAELAAQIPEADWDEARQLLRMHINRLLARVRAAAKEETQLAYLLRGDYAAFHQKWSFVGLYRADGSLDDSMVRVVAATGIRGRGFTFPEYVALMTHLYGAAAVAKWGTKQAWREELAALWHKAQPARYAPKPAPKLKAPRGRAGDHAALVEKVYQLLLDHRAGAEAIIHIADLANAIGAHRRTVTSILIELSDAERISKRRLAGGGGLVITFTEPKRDVIIEATQAPELPVPARENDVAPIYAEETREANCVSSDRANADHISQAAHSDDSPAGGYSVDCVQHADGRITWRLWDDALDQVLSAHATEAEALAAVPQPAPEPEPITLAEAVQQAFADLPRTRPDPNTGEVKGWQITDKRVFTWLEATYPDRYTGWSPRSIAARIRRVRTDLRWAMAREIRVMPADELKGRREAVHKSIIKLERKAAEASDPAIRESWAAQAAKKRGMLALLVKETERRSVWTPRQCTPVIEQAALFVEVLHG